MKRKLTFKLFVALSLFTQQLHAQTPITTPTDLANACLNSPGNVITLTQSTKVSLPNAPNTITNVPCGCTIILNNEAKLELEQVALNFSGALSIQSTGKGDFKATKSFLGGASVNINLAGTGSAFALSQARLAASTGNLIVTLGSQAKMELYGIYSTSSNETLSSNGIINISAGERFTGSFADMSIKGLQGITIAASGFESLIKVEKIGFRAHQGSINILAQGNKSNLEVMESNFSAGNETKIDFRGSETGIKLIESVFTGPNNFPNTTSTGGVTIISAGANNSNGKIEMAEVSANNIGGNWLVSSAANGEKGGVKFEKGNLNINGAIEFKTGNLGSTEVKENRIVSAQRITISTGATGVCVSTPNVQLTAPIVQACVTALAASNIPAASAKIGNASVSSNKSGLRVFPNPAPNGIINVNFATTNNSIVVKDLSGRVVKNIANYNQPNLQISHLTAGMYLLESTNNISLNKQSQKFVISN